MLPMNCVDLQIEHELEHLVATSTKPFLRQAMQQHDQNQKQDGISAPAAGGGQFSSITKRFLKSVKDLTQELQGPHMQLHFIRCFIPNCGMKPDKFERKVVLHQVGDDRNKGTGSTVVYQKVCSEMSPGNMENASSVVLTEIG